MNDRLNGRSWAQAQDPSGPDNERPFRRFFKAAIVRRDGGGATARPTVRRTESLTYKPPMENKCISPNCNNLQCDDERRACDCPCHGTGEPDADAQVKDASL
jgi:hypothetical protein